MAKHRLSRPIIVFGTGRSGTTIISEALFRHPDLAWPSNYDHLRPGKAYASLVRWLFDNPFYRYEGKKEQLHKAGFLNRYAFKPGESYSMWEAITGSEIDFSRGFLLDERLSDPQKHQLLSFFDAMVRFQGRSRLAFKLTGPARMGFLLDLFPDARFIHIRRDAVPTISSWLKVEFWQDKGMDQLWWQGAYSPDEQQFAEGLVGRPELLGALQYRKLNQVFEIEAARWRPALLEIRYEDFVLNPRTALQEMLDFSDLKPSRWIDRYLTNNPVRSDLRPETEYFEPEQLEAIHRILRPGTLPKLSL